MRLNTIKPGEGSKKAAKRVGRGIGSGLGKTCGRGHKGQKSRSGGFHKVGFEGGQMPLQRRLPKRGFNNVNRVDYVAVNVCDLERFDAGTVVTTELLREVGLAKGKIDGVKILGTGELTKKLTIQVSDVSASAKAKIEAVGGTIELI